MLGADSSAAQRPPSSNEEAGALMIQQATGDGECELKYSSIARVCVQEALRVSRGQANGEQGSRTDSVKSAEAQDNLDRLMAKVRQHGRWTRGAGMTARQIIRGLPAVEARQARRQVHEVLSEEQIDPHPGAWVPPEH